MNPRDRRANLAIFGAALLAWLAVGWFLSTFDPAADPAVRYGASLLLGLALGLTAVPLFWLAAFAGQSRIAYRGDWARAARRGAWVGGLLGALALLRVEGMFSPPIALFLGALVFVAEVSLSTRR